MTTPKIPLTRLFQQSSQFIAIDEQRRVFVGTPGKMKQAEVTDYRVFRDGGTTNISSDLGNIYIPSRLKGGIATFNGLAMQEHSAADEQLVKKLKISDIAPQEQPSFQPRPRR